MANAKCYIDEIRFNLRNEDYTECYVFLRTNECLCYIDGWHAKTFPVNTSVVDILSSFGGDGHPMMWPFGAPK